MRRMMWLGSAMAVCYAFACGATGARNARAQSDSPRVIEISAKKYEFDPAEIHVKLGEHVELKVHSIDEPHGIKIDVYPEGSKDKGKPGLTLEHPEQNVKVEKNVDQVIDLVASEAGTYDFKCAKVCGFGHGRMQGKLIVEP